MPTPAERKALLFAAGVVMLGAGVRLLRSDSVPPSPSGAAGLDRQIAAADSAYGASRQARHPARSARGDGGRATSGDSSRRRAARSRAERSVGSRRTGRDSVPFWVVPPPAPAGVAPALIDVDRASAEELERLPGIGPALAARIVGDRERSGPFGSLDGLDRVSGVGPSLRRRLGPHVTFSGTARPPSVAGVGASAPSRPFRPSSPPP